MTSGYHQPVANHYEKFPYPYYPLYGLGAWSQLESVDLKSWGLHSAPKDLWIAGCGTIAPLMFGRRNPNVKIIATDLSSKTIRLSKKRLKLYGIRNVSFLQQDLLQAGFEENFDAVDAYGVISSHDLSRKKFKNISKVSQNRGGFKIDGLLS